MNDEATSSTSAVNNNATELDDGLHNNDAAPLTAEEPSVRRRKNRKLFNHKRASLLDDLLRNLDILVYAELSVLYYLDCAIFPLLLRSVLHFLFLTPKPGNFPRPPPSVPVIPAILMANLLCLASHLYFAPPTAGEATRGYLHGGVLMDFIGQFAGDRGVGRWRLCALDAVVAGLQVGCLVFGGVRRGLKDNGGGGEGNALEGREERQDIDAEERGVSREDEAGDIEMQTLNPTHTASSTSDDPASSLLANDTAPPQSESSINAAFHSGQILIADIDVWKQLQEQMRMTKEARLALAASASNSGGSSGSRRRRSLRAEVARRFVGMRMGVDTMRDGLR